MLCITRSIGEGVFIGHTFITLKHVTFPRQAVILDVDGESVSLIKGQSHMMHIDGQPVQVKINKLNSPTQVSLGINAPRYINIRREELPPLKRDIA